MSLLSYSEFSTKYLEKITIVKMFDFFALHSELSQLLKIEEIKLNNASDLIQLGEHRLVWYKNEDNNPTGWEKIDAKNVVLKEEAKYRINLPKNQDVNKLINSFMNDGITENINIVVAYDETIKKSLIVDGVHRAVALMNIFITNPEKAIELLKSENSINIIKISSPNMGMYFPADFFHLY